jgi:hypothetical protein
MKANAVGLWTKGRLSIRKNKQQATRILATVPFFCLPCDSGTTAGSLCYCTGTGFPNAVCPEIVFAFPNFVVRVANGRFGGGMPGAGGGAFLNSRVHVRVAVMSGDQSVPLWPVAGVRDLSKLKLRQRSKITEIRAALVDAGLVALDEQAATLGLSRSTAWSILKPSHKSSGLSARTISRILRSPRLPGRVRQRLFEYMQEKIEGLYGHTERRRREFAECLMAALRNEFKSSI